MGRIDAAVLVFFALAAGAPAVHARAPVDALVSADHVGATVRDVHGRLVGTVREVEYDRDGDVLNVVITLGALPGGGERYVVLPWHHLDASGGTLRFRGARERLADAPRRSNAPAR